MPNRISLFQMIYTFILYSHYYFILFIGSFCKICNPWDDFNIPMCKGHSLQFWLTGKLFSFYILFLRKMIRVILCFVKLKKTLWNNFNYFLIVLMRKKLQSKNIFSKVPRLDADSFSYKAV